MAIPRTDIVVHGTGIFSDGPEFTCHVSYILYQAVQGRIMFPFRGSVVVQEQERDQAVISVLKNLDHIYTLTLESPLENGWTAINVYLTRMVRNPGDGMFEFVLASAP